MKKPKLTVLSFGGGQDSVTIFYKILYDPAFRLKYAPGDYIVVMADTKNEHESTYEYIEIIRGLCEKEGIPFFLINPEKYASVSWKKGLIHFYELKNTVGSKAFPKSCTDKLKIQVIYKFLEDYIHKTYKTEKHGRKSAFYEFVEKHGKIRVLIGIARGEEKRASENGSSGIKWFDKCIEKRYHCLKSE